MTKLFLIAVSILLAVVIGRAAQMRIAGGGADAEASQIYPVFIIDLGDSWTDFELKASTNNFTGGDCVDLAYFYISSLTNTCMEDPDPFLYFTDSGFSDVREWKKSAKNTSILSQLTDTNSVCNKVIFMPSLNVVTNGVTNSTASWLTISNTNLVWSYVRYDGVGYELDPASRQIWTPIVPVEWRVQRIVP